jgi:hypothetical protein
MKKCFPVVLQTKQDKSVRSKEDREVQEIMSGVRGADSLHNFVVEMPDAEVALFEGLWDWNHGDLVDRTLVAIAKEKNLTLITRTRF